MTHSFPTRRASGLRHGAGNRGAERRSARLAACRDRDLVGERASGRAYRICPAPRQSWREGALVAAARAGGPSLRGRTRSREIGRHTSELQSLMRISYAVFCLKKKKISIRLAYQQTNLRSHHYKV